MTEDLNTLRRRWRESGLPEDEQAYLAVLMQVPDTQYVFIDPDGTLPPWLSVVVRRPTGVIYANQCGGVACETRLIEGFLVPLGGNKYVPDMQRINVDLFTKVFHDRDNCIYPAGVSELPKYRLDMLSRLVEDIPYWQCGADTRARAFQLRLDTDRSDEIAEAWIPVTTPDGPGVLLYKNCD